MARLRLFFYLSLLGFSISLFIHIVTFFGINLAGYGLWAYSPHFGIFVLVILAIFLSPFGSIPRDKTGLNNLLLPVPPEYRRALKWTFVYAIINGLALIVIDRATHGALAGDWETRAQSMIIHLSSAFLAWLYFSFCVLAWFHGRRQEMILRKHPHHRE